MCVLWVLPSNGFTCHIAPSLRLFAPNSLWCVTVPSFLRSLLVMSHLLSRCSFFFTPQCSFSNLSHCFLLKDMHPQQLTKKIPVSPYVQTLTFFCPFSFQWCGQYYPEWPVLPHSGPSYTNIASKFSSVSEGADHSTRFSFYFP
jgi:hypothetical protein